MGGVIIDDQLTPAGGKNPLYLAVKVPKAAQVDLRNLMGKVPSATVGGYTLSDVRVFVYDETQPEPRTQVPLASATDAASLSINSRAGKRLSIERAGSGLVISCSHSMEDLSAPEQGRPNVPADLIAFGVYLDEGDGPETVHVNEVALRIPKMMDPRLHVEFSFSPTNGGPDQPPSW